MAKTPCFSLIYPTRDRPLFVKNALNFLEHSTFTDFEVVLVDNSSSDSQHGIDVMASSSHLNIKYVRTDGSLSMVDNWNLAFSYVSGRYVSYFTDKMMLLPETLRIAEHAIMQSGADMLSWVDNSFTPDKFPNYFGSGTYIRRDQQVRISENFELFNPEKSLQSKLSAQMSRGEMDPVSYAQGKICFGAYSRDLCDEIVKQTGKLFHPIAPDYTSMVAGLLLASRAIQLAEPGIVHINTDLSNGGRADRYDIEALSFLRTMPNSDQLITNLYVPNLYASASNMVASDYLRMLEKLDSSFRLNDTTWLTYITEDLDRRVETWSEDRVRVAQYFLLEDYLNANISEAQKRQIEDFKRLRMGLSQKNFLTHQLKKFLKDAMPNGLFLELKKLHQYMTKDSSRERLKELSDLI